MLNAAQLVSSSWVLNAAHLVSSSWVLTAPGIELTASVLTAAQLVSSSRAVRAERSLASAERSSPAQLFVVGHCPLVTPANVIRRQPFVWLPPASMAPSWQRERVRTAESETLTVIHHLPFPPTLLEVPASEPSASSNGGGRTLASL